MPKNKLINKGDPVISLRLPPPLVKKIEETARRGDLTASQVIRAALRFYFQGKHA